MINWNYDVEAAKSEGLVLACSDSTEKTSVDGVKPEEWVGFTRWLPDENRWMMMGLKQAPLCWVKAEHPLSLEAAQ